MSSFVKLLMPIIVVLWGLAGYTQWYEIYQYSNGFGIQDNIEVTEDGKVFILHVDSIHRSIDFGETWSIDSSWGNGATKIQFVSADTGYVCCGLEDYEENHLMTIDGGLTWMPCGTDINFAILDIEYLPGNLVKAAEGGLSSFVLGGKYCLSLIWQDDLATMGEVYDLDVLNDSVMFMCGEIFPYDPFAFSTTIKSLNNGESWQVSGDGFDVPYFGMDWPTDSVGYGNGLINMYKTIDQGETWFKLPNPFGEDDYIYYYAPPVFINKEIGYVQGGRYPVGGTSSDSENLGILRTIDGGMSWYITDTPEDFKCGQDITCLNEDTCYYLCKGKLFRTFNGGGIGEPLSVTGQQHLSLTLHPNPATDLLFLEGLASYPDAVWSTYSISGQTIPLDLCNGHADISHLPPGIYLTTVQTQQGIWREKWVKL